MNALEKKLSPVRTGSGSGEDAACEHNTKKLEHVVTATKAQMDAGTGQQCAKDGLAHTSIHEHATS